MKNLVEKIIFGIAVFVTSIAFIFMGLDMKQAFKEPENMQIELVFEDYINPNQSHEIIDKIIPNAKLIRESHGSSTITVKTKDKERLLDRLRRSIGIKDARER